MSCRILPLLVLCSLGGAGQGFVIRPPPSSPSPPGSVRTLLIDNYDSYTYNLAHYLAEVNGVPPVVVYNDELGSDWEAVKAKVGPFDNVVISPGPGSPDVPEDFGISAGALREADLPLLGICLGHQGLGSAHGGHVRRAPTPMHGRLARIRHSARGIFKGLSPDFLATRYHSLIVEPPSPAGPWDLEETAWTSDGLIMGLEHREWPHFGVQFHPESIGTEHGHQLLRNFKDLTLGWWAAEGSRRRPQESILRPPVYTTYEASKLTQPRVVGGGVESSRGAARYHVLVKRVQASPRLSTESLFTALYGHEDTAFWLDSSAAQEDGDEQQPSSSPADPARDAQQQQSEQHNCPWRVKGRFSFMGGLQAGGRLAHVVEYYYASEAAGGKLIRVGRPRQSGGSEERPVEPEVVEGTSILRFLKDKMAAYREAGVAVKEQSRGSGEWVDGSLPFEFCGGYVGYLAYELKDDCLAMQRDPQLLSGHQSAPSQAAAVGVAAQAVKDVPESTLVFADRFVAYDHTRKEAYLVAVVDSQAPGDVQEGSEWLAATEARVQGLSAAATRGEMGDGLLTAGSSPPPAPYPADLYPLVSAAGYKRRVQQCLDYITAGESYEVCLTSQLCMEGSTAPFPLYSRIRRANPAPFSAFLRHDPGRRLGGGPPPPPAMDGSAAVAVCCSSPERFLRVGRADGLVESRPIKGTVRRGKSRSEDAALAASLASSEKNRAENLMIVDLVRNDLSRVTLPGSVRVPSLMSVEGYATVHQLVSTVTGRLEPGRDAMDALVASFPGGSMTGAPKKRTMEIIDRLERHPRGVYSGSLGWIAMDGMAADLNIVIRTAVVTPQNVTIGAGGAVVALSDPEDEYQEMRLKAQAVAGAAFRDPRSPDTAGPRVHHDVFWASSASCGSDGRARQAKPQEEQQHEASRAAAALR